MTNGDVKNGVIRYWQLIVVMGAFLIGWGSLQSEVSALQSALAEEKRDSVKQQDKQGESEKTIVRIETTQQEIRKDVDEIKEEQKEQSKKLDRILEKLAER